MKKFLLAGLIFLAGSMYFGGALVQAGTIIVRQWDYPSGNIPGNSITELTRFLIIPPAYIGKDGSDYGYNNIEQISIIIKPKSNTNDIDFQKKFQGFGIKIETYPGVDEADSQRIIAQASIDSLNELGEMQITLSGIIFSGPTILSVVSISKDGYSSESLEDSSFSVDVTGFGIGGTYDMDDYLPIKGSEHRFTNEVVAEPELYKDGNTVSILNTGSKGPAVLKKIFFDGIVESIFGDDPNNTEYLCKNNGSVSYCEFGNGIGIPDGSFIIFTSKDGVDLNVIDAVITDKIYGYRVYVDIK